MWELHPKRVHHMRLKILFYGDSSPKDCKVCTMVFIIISTFYFFKASYSHMMLLQMLIQLTIWNYWMQNMRPKTPIYLKERSGWMFNHIHLHLFPMYQTNHQMPPITFHPSMDRFYIIENLGFGQIYILDLPLL
jgi:hypothetical protein